MDIKLDSSWSQIGGSTFPIFSRGPLSTAETVFYVNNGGGASNGGIKWWQQRGVYFNNRLASGVMGLGTGLVTYENLTPGDTNFKRITVVAKGGLVKIYINGALTVNTLWETRDEVSARKWTPGLPFVWQGLVGADPTPPGTGKVSIKNFYWWNRDLTSSEVSTLNTDFIKDPRQTMWDTGFKSLDAPFWVGHNSPVIQKPVFVNNSTPVTYTMSLDLWIQGTGTTYRNVLVSNPQSSGINLRKPLLFLMGTAEGTSVNKLGFMHTPGARATIDYQNMVYDGVYSTTALTPGRWYNIIITVDSSVPLTPVLKMYVNGTLESTATWQPAWTPGPLTWFQDDNWTLRPDGPGYAGNPTDPAQSEMAVANFAMWNRVLSQSEISQLSVPSTVTPGMASTSYYMPEPFGGSSYSSY
jgi:hypothetical protein